MKSLITLIFLLIACGLPGEARAQLNLPAQTNEPVRLALLVESDRAADVGVVLTAQLSSNIKLQLLERTEIERVYREQGLSAANTDYLKLGHILGADGLLLLNVVTTEHETNLTARLIAVKPGVVLLAEKYSWFMPNLNEWASSYANHLNLFLPKLTLLVKDAIPISVVNLRCAAQSTDAPEVEQQLKLLTIERLSQERQFFVLERQRMNLVTEEKELKLDDSAFWNGGYLLEGVVDQNGFVRDVITINARLTPPRGGAPLLLEVSGGRTNFTEVINRLSARVNELLKINATPPEWNAAEESAQYFKEALWALQWGVLPEAQAAADSAWALGKRDLDCAIVRVRAHVAAVSEGVGHLEIEDAGYSPGFNADGVALGPPLSHAELQSKIEQMLKMHPLGLTYEIETQGATRTVHYVYPEKQPDPMNIDLSLHALDVYEQFSQDSPEGAAKVDGQKEISEWYDVGVEDLVAASKVLQSFNFAPVSQETVAEKLAELRAQARRVAARICQSPPVHDSYYTGDRVVHSDELHQLLENPGIFGCLVKWGCFWQERPGDAIALYRQLMSTPAFCCIHMGFWFRGDNEWPTPRLVAWNESGKRSIPVLWKDFMRELNNYTNFLLRLEARAVRFADADNDEELTASFNDFFDAFLESRGAMISNNVDVLYLNWHADELVGKKAENGVSSDAKTLLHKRYRTECLPKLAARDQEFRKLLMGRQTDAEFEKQKRYLQDNTPFDFQKYVKLFEFGFKDYSKAQALEIQPLLTAYKSNLEAQLGNLPAANQGQVRIGISQLHFVETRVDHILNPPASRPGGMVQARAPAVVPAGKAAPPNAVSTNATEIASPVITVGDFLEIPTNGLPGSEIQGIKITAHHWIEGKLLLDFQYNAFFYSFDEKGAWKATTQPTLNAIALLDPATRHWDVIACPETTFEKENHFYHKSTLLQGDLFSCNGGQIQRFDSRRRSWEALPIPQQNNDELFAIDGHFYAANENIIFEIVDGGKATRILASARRNPGISVLDRLDGFGVPILFAGLNHTLRASLRDKTYSWLNDDWHEDCATPFSVPPTVFDDGVLFRHTSGFGHAKNLSLLAMQAGSPELCLAEAPAQWARKTASPGFLHQEANAVASPQPFWKIPPEFSLANLAAALRRSDLYLLADHSSMQEIVDDQHVLVQEKILTKNGCHAAMLCLSHDQPASVKLFLKFDSARGCPPVAGINSWMLFAGNLLCFGLEKFDDPMAIAPQRIGIGYQAGVWMLPVSEIDAAVAAQRRSP
jgi:hypothetical protein